MAGLLNIIGKLFGNKYDKDVKEIAPLVEQINNEFAGLSSISNDELRAKTTSLKQEINAFVVEEKEEIVALKKKATNKETSPEEKENLYNQIDELEKIILRKIEDCLNRILPEAFAVVKETARRFSENDSIEVIVTESDIVMRNKDNKTETVSCDGQMVFTKN